MFNVNEKDRAWVDAQCTPQPIKCFLQRLTLTRARERVGIKAFIRATGYPSEPFDHGMANARAKGWRTCRPKSKSPRASLREQTALLTKYDEDTTNKSSYMARFF